MDGRRQPIIHKPQGVLLTDDKVKFPDTQYKEHFGTGYDNFVAPESFKKIEKFEPPTIPMALGTSYRNTFKGT